MINIKRRHRVLSVLLWVFVGTLYFFTEVIWKTAHGRPEAISWTMLALAIFLAIPLERFGAEMKWTSPIWFQGFICGTGIMVAEFLSGVVLNIWLKLGIWDYSEVPFNLLGQVCLPFYLVWILLSIPAIIMLDYIRYWVEGGEEPRYYLNF